jgi:hypothetical protein
MNKKNQFYPGFTDENADRDKKLKDELGAKINKDDLSYNEEDDSFELDVESTDGEYDHPDPYDTAVRAGGDFDSDYDEANPTAVNEYDKDLSLENEVEKLGMHIDRGDIVHVDPIDEEMAQTPEDYREDLDEEGYPKNDLPDPS